MHLDVVRHGEREGEGEREGRWAAARTFFRRGYHSLIWQASMSSTDTRGASGSAVRALLRSPSEAIGGRGPVRGAATLARRWAGAEPAAQEAA